jgi:hypothetical protein
MGVRNRIPGIKPEALRFPLRQTLDSQSDGASPQVGKIVVPIWDSIGKGRKNRY